MGQIVPHTPITINCNTVLNHRTKIDAQNNSEPLIKRLNCLDYCLWDKNGFIVIKVQKGKSFALKINCYLENSLLWNTSH